MFAKHCTARRRFVHARRSEFIRGPIFPSEIVLDASNIVHRMIAAMHNAFSVWFGVGFYFVQRLSGNAG